MPTSATSRCLHETSPRVRTPPRPRWIARDLDVFVLYCYLAARKDEREWHVRCALVTHSRVSTPALRKALANLAKAPGMVRQSRG